MIKNIAKWGFLLFLIIATIFIIRRHQQNINANDVPFQENRGQIFGTQYCVIYASKEDYATNIHEILNSVDASLSLFNKSSTLSKVNRGETNILDAYMKEVLMLAQYVSTETNGAFDCTVAPAVNTWGFGFENRKFITPAVIDSLRDIIGYEKIHIVNDSIIELDDHRMNLDFGAIAKGFAVDKIAEFLSSKQIDNYMVEIGGEIIAHGFNKEGKAWKIGIQNPNNTGFSQILNVTDQAMATSGNYLNYYVNEKGERVAHTIDPKTAQPVAHTLLSATVIAPTCAMADAFATAFMVLGLEKSKLVLENNPQLMAYLIYSDGDNIKQFSWNLEGEF